MPNDSLSQEGRLLAMALAMRSAIVDMEVRLDQLISELQVLQTNDKRLYVPVSILPAPLPAPQDEPTETFSEVSLLSAIEEQTGFGLDSLIGLEKGWMLSLARQIGMYLLYRYTPMSYPEIATFFSGRDHTTIVHGVARVKKLIVTDAAVAVYVRELEARFGLDSTTIKPSPPKSTAQKAAATRGRTRAAAEAKAAGRRAARPIPPEPTPQPTYWAWESIKKKGG